MTTRTPEEIMADYKEFRGRCKELAEAACAADSELTLVRGYYFCLQWAREEQHWWCTKPDGTIVDPSARQFPCNGAGIYTPFDGFVECAECGKSLKEEDAIFESRYAFCSSRCLGRFVGVF